MRICFVSYTYWPPDFGGELLISIERFEALVKHGWSITVLTSGRPTLPDEDCRTGLHVLRSPLVGKGRLARAIRRLAFPLWACFQLARLQFDVMHLGSTGGFGGVSSALVAWLCCSVARLRGGRTLIVHSLADADDVAFDVRGWGGFWRKRLYACFQHIVAVSPTLHKGLLPHFPHQAVLVTCGVRDDLFVRSPESVRIALRREHGVTDTAVVFSFLGAVSQRKGFDLLSQAFAQAAADHPTWQLWVIGPRTKAENQNVDETEVAVISAPLNSLSNRVRYWGRVDNRAQLAEILSASDVFVFPSRREGMGIAPMEAMAVGVPVVVSRIPGITDLANVEGDTGLYVAPGDLPALKTVLLRLGTDENLRKRTGVRAAQVVREGFAWEQHITKWMNLYNGNSATEKTSFDPVGRLMT